LDLFGDLLVVPRECIEEGGTNGVLGGIFSVKLGWVRVLLLWDWGDLRYEDKRHWRGD
jgi:hypothetical protein